MNEQLRVLCKPCVQGRIIIKNKKLNAAEETTMLNAYYAGQTDIVLADDHNEENTADYDQMKNIKKDQKKAENSSDSNGTSEVTENTSESDGKSVVYDLQGGFSLEVHLSQLKFETKNAEKVFLWFVFILYVFSKGTYRKIKLWNTS